MKLHHHILEINTEDLLSGRIENLLPPINASLKEQAINTAKILRMDAYLALSSMDDFSFVQQQIHVLAEKIGSDKIPAYSTNPQLLDDNKSQLIIKYHNDSKVQTEYKVFQKHHYTLCHSAGEKLLISGQIDFNTQNDPLRSTQLVYDFMEQLLDHEEMHFGHMIECHTTIDSHFLNQKYGEMTAWQMLEQVRQLYFDPTLFKNCYPALSDKSILTGGISASFMAGSKASFPIHQAIPPSEKETFRNAVYLADWKQNLINHIHSKPSSSGLKSENIITQCKACMNQLKSIHSKQSELQYKMIMAYIKNEDDIPDARLILEQHLPSKHVTYIISNFENPECLIALDAISTFK